MRIDARALRTWGLPLALGLLTLALYAPALRHGFLVYDDQQYVTENPLVRAGLTAQGLRWAFGMHATNWHPLTWLSHMLDCQVYGLHAWGHHLTNVLLHALNTVLLFVLLHRLTQAPWRSAAVAALFAWHPLHVESVAWVAERKDVLSGCFWLLTLLAYCTYVKCGEEGGCKNGKGGASGSRSTLHTPRSTLHTPRSTPHAPRSTLWYLLTLLCFTLGLMSKPMVVTLPFTLLLLDFWPLQRFAFPRALSPTHPSIHQSINPSSPPSTPPSPGLPWLLLEKLPFLLLTAGACALTLSAQQMAMVSTTGLSLAQRLEHTPVAYVHYLWALLAPHDLAVYYPYEKALPLPQVLLAVAVLAGVTGLALGWARQRPYLAVGWLWFLGTLVPVIGLVQVGEQAWADRYTYLPSIGVFLIVVWGVADLAERRPALRLALPWVGAAAGVALVVATSAQLRYWQDSRTLFTHTGQVTRNNPLSATLLGSLLAQEGKYDQAIELYRTALSYSPGFPEAHFYLGHAYDQQGQLDAAVAEYQKALWYKPIQEQTHIVLGTVLGKQHKPDQAAEQFLAALKLNPQSAVAQNNLAKLLHAQGRLEDAIAHYSEALKLNPDLAQAHNNLGVLLLQKGQVAEGVVQLREALRLKPGDVETQLNLAQGLAQQEQWSAAAELFAQAITPTTADPSVRCQYANVLDHQHRTREAISQYAAALLLQPEQPEALDGLSWLLATAPEPQLRNGTEAQRMAERACQLTGRKDPVKLKTLAAACAENGQFTEATQTAQAAHDLAAQANRQALAAQCTAMAEQFKAAKPWRTQ